MARPALEFSQPIADAILERISVGEDLTSICKDGDMPSLTVVYKWLHSTPGFGEDYTRAREVQAEVFAAQAREIAQRTHVELPNGMFVAADATRDRLAVDTLKWTASHLNGKRWGDKTQIEMSGSLTLIDASEEDLVAELVDLITSGRLVLPNGAQLVTDEPEEEDFSDLA